MKILSSRAAAVLALPLLATGALFALRARSIETKLTAPPGHATHRHTSTAGMPTPRRVATVADLYGAYLFGDDGEYQIEELVWGIQHNGNIGIAVLRAESSTGKRVDWSHPERYARTAVTPDELKGAYMTDGVTKERFKIDTIEYGVFKDGHMGVTAWSGWDEKGKPVSFGMPSSQAEPPCCGLYTESPCVSADCSGSCPGTGSCACTGDPPLQGSCTLNETTVCKGVCKDEDPCYTFDSTCNGSVTNCKCFKIKPPPPH